MKVFLPACFLHNPFVGPSLQDHSVMPIATDSGGDGFDLDYSSLLVAEQFIADQAAVDLIEEKRDRFLGPMWKSIVALRSEGLLDVADFGEPCRRYRVQIEQKTIQLLESVDPWVPIAQEQWRQVQPEFADFAQRYSLPGHAKADAAHYGVLAYLERRDGTVREDEYERLHKLLMSKRRRLTAGEVVDVREVLKPLVAQVVINGLVGEHLRAPFIDWDDATGFYERLQAGQWTELRSGVQPTSRLAAHAHSLFHVVVPELMPRRIEDVIRFVRNRKAVASLRQELWDAMQAGEAISSKWMLALQNEATTAQLRAERRSRKIKWVGRICGAALPVVGAFLGVAAEMATEVGMDAAEAGAEHFGTGRRRFEWYYALQRLEDK